MIRPKFPRRLIPRFSLRTLFVLVTIAGLLAWWVNSQLRWIRHRREADPQIGYPEFVSFVARDELHRAKNKELPWELRLFGEKAVSVLHCHPASALKVGDLRDLFPEADIIEVYYPSTPEKE